MTVYNLQPRGVVSPPPPLTAAPVRSIDNIQARLTLAAQFAGETPEAAYLLGFREGRRSARRPVELMPRPKLEALTIGVAFFLGRVTATGLLFTAGVFTLKGLFWLLAKVLP